MSSPTLSSPRLRMDPLPGGVSGDVSHVTCHDRHLCHFPQQQASGVFFSGGGSSGSGSRRDVTTMGSPSGLRVPSLWSHSSPSGQSSSVLGSGADARGSILASEALVSGLTGTVGGGSSSSAVVSGSAPSAPFSSLSSQPPRSSVDWLSHCERSARTLGFSASVAHQLARSRRSSTHRNYQSKWVTYRNLCHRHGRSVSSPTIPKIADFLLSLRRSLHLSYSSIASYR